MAADVHGMPMYFEAPAEVLAKIDESGHVKKGLIASAHRGIYLGDATLHHGHLLAGHESFII